METGDRDDEINGPSHNEEGGEAAASGMQQQVSHEEGELSDALENHLKGAPKQRVSLMRHVPPAEQKHLMNVVAFTEMGSAIRMTLNGANYKMHFGKEDFGVDTSERELLRGKDNVSYNAGTPYLSSETYADESVIKKGYQLTYPKIQAICQALCPDETWNPDKPLRSLGYFVAMLGCEEKGTMRGDEVYGAIGKYNNKPGAQCAEIENFNVSQEEVIVSREAAAAKEEKPLKEYVKPLPEGHNDAESGGSQPTIALMTASKGMLKP